jgi:hypothetical protein
VGCLQRGHHVGRGGEVRAVAGLSGCDAERYCEVRLAHGRAG